MATRLLSPIRAGQFYDWTVVQPEDESRWRSIQCEPSLAQVEWDYIQRILQDSGGNITRAAHRLGLHRRTLQRKLHKLPPLS
jgi:ActR/RegA family two-component response regulator